MGVLSWSVTVSFFTAGAMNSRGIASMASFVGYRSFLRAPDRGRLMISLVSICTICLAFAKMKGITSQSFKLRRRDLALRGDNSSDAIRIAVQSGSVPHISFQSMSPARYGGCLICCGIKYRRGRSRSMAHSLWPLLPTNVPSPSRYLSPLQGHIPHPTTTSDSE